jgi:GT2 family glycosyltransferase
MEKSPPFISVIIPTYERPDDLSRCLRALAAQDYPRDRFEVLVVDDGSAASINESIDSLRHRLNMTLLRQPHSGPATARNHGAAHAKGSYLAFTDDDCIPAPDWLRRLSTSFALFPESVLGGRTINALVHNLYSTASQLLVDYLQVRWNSSSTRASFFASNNLALPAKCFKAVGGFDPRWDRAAGEDRDLCDRLIRHGYRLVSAPGALVQHAHVLTFRTFWRQHVNYGWGAYHLHQLRAQRGTGHIQFEPLTFYLKAIAYPFTQTQARRAGFLSILLGVAQAANAVGWIAAGLSSFGRRSPGRRGQEMQAFPGAYERLSVFTDSVKRMLKILRRT